MSSGRAMCEERHTGTWETPEVPDGRDEESRPFFLKGRQVSVSDAENGGALTASGSGSGCRPGEAPQHQNRGGVI